VRSFRERRPWLVGITSIALITIGMGFAFSINRFEELRGVYSIAADLQDAAGLQAGNEVRVAGVKVGRVTRVSLTPKAARVEMEIANDIDIPSETKLFVKLKTLLGQKYIDLQFPRAFLTAASDGDELTTATDGFLGDGDVIPLSQTRVPFEIHQAATEGTEVLEGIDKASLRRLVDVLGRTIGVSKDELGDALSQVDRAGEVLAGKGPEISRLLRNAEQVSGTLASSDRSLEGILGRGAEVLGVLAERRDEISTLLAAVDDLSRNLGLLIRVSRGHVATGVGDLNQILISAEGELDSIEEALAELGPAQELFGRPLRFGRFVEGHVCAVTTADTCVPFGSPRNPGLPSHGIQPEPEAGRVLP
jgi:phospholipid/cholesterol/gamma-HCH transport system substrate-binding protein